MARSRNHPLITSWHRLTTLAPATLAILAIRTAGADHDDDDAPPDMIRLTVDEIAA